MALAAPGGPGAGHHPGVERHWTTGFNLYLNVFIRTLKQVPDSVPSFMKALGKDLGIQPEDLISYFSGSQSGLGTAAVSAQGRQTNPSFDFATLRGYVDDASMSLLRARLSVPDDTARNIGSQAAFALAGSSSDDIYRDILQGIGKFWSLTTKLVVSAGSNTGALSTLGIGSSDDGQPPLGMYLIKKWFENDRANRAVLKWDRSWNQGRFRS